MSIKGETADGGVDKCTVLFAQLFCKSNTVLKLSLLIIFKRIHTIILSIHFQMYL